MSLKRELLLQVENLTKTFPGVRALDTINFSLYSGSVHAVCGENGAGKSTLMNVLMGLYQPDEGTIFLRGKEVSFLTPKHALDAGIAMIEQELNPVRYMTIAENLFLGREDVHYGFILDSKKLDKKAAEVLAQLELDLDPSLKMKDLSIAQIQLVEIAKAISYDSDIVIMDEPTSAIAEKDTEILFKVIKMLQKKGKAIVYVSHRMHEIFKISDTITVFRDGKLIDTCPTDKITHEELVSKMIGRTLEDEYVKHNTPSDEVILELKNFTRNSKFRNVDLNLHRGEILGIFGLMGSGRSELFESLFGVYPADGGTIVIDGKEVRIKRPADAMKKQIAFVTEDRKESGLVLKSSVRDNISLPNLSFLSDGVFINKKREVHAVQKVSDRFRVKTPSLDQLVSRLSGGNQQKVVLSKWLLREPKILLLDEPTRGIDVGAKREIYAFMSEFANAGNAVIMISSELPEVINMSDRIAVFHKGSKVAERLRGKVTEDELLRLASVGTQKIKEEADSVKNTSEFVQE